MFKKAMDAGQLLSGLMILGVVGGTERGRSLNDLRYTLLFFGLMLLCQLMKELAKAMAKEKACSESRTFRTRKAYRVGKHQTVR